MPKNKTIRNGSEVEMHFRLTLENGFVVEDTHEDENKPFCFTLGDGSIVAGLEQALDGIEENAKEKIILSPEQAYGYTDPENIMDMPRAEFPDDMPLKEGVIVGFATPSGEEVPGTVKFITDEMVTVDFNHPLSGKTIIFDVEVVGVKNAPLN